MIINPFDTDAFNLVSMVAAVNRLPNLYGRLNQLGLFKDKGVASRTIVVENKDGVLNLLQDLPPGSPGQMNTKGTRAARSFVIPHLPLDDLLLPSEYENVRAFGTENQAETLASIMNDKLQTMKNKHAITLEYFRMGAVKGLILSADGSTLYDLYQEFVMPKKSVNFALNSDTTDVRAKCLEVKRHIETYLKGEVMSEVRVLCDKDFFDALTNHPKVITAYERWQNGEALRSDMRAAFPFGGLMFEEYEGTATTVGGTARKFITSKYAHAFPMGTMNTFYTYYAPGDFNETANTIGLPFYAKQEPVEFNRGIKVHTQSNPLPLCLRPELLVEISTP